jgi:surface protein
MEQHGQSQTKTTEAKRRRLSAFIIERHSLLLPDDLWLPILVYLDVKTLIEKKDVCRSWRVNCTAAIDAKQTACSRKAFTTNAELRKAVQKYCGYNEATNSYSQCDPQDTEEIAQTYGYPIDKWNVSNLQDFEYIFSNVDTFNEDISSWNVSNATTMRAMLYKAVVFDQDLSSWNVTRVTDMGWMFARTCAFDNDSIGSWNVSNVMDMSNMFRRAIAFNHDLSSWNVQNVTDMRMMFKDASSFNQNLSRWNVSNVEDMSDMFQNATKFDQDVESWDSWDSCML